MFRRQVSVAAVLVLAIGIGASTGIFSVVHHVLLRPLPYADGDRLVMLWSTDRRLTDDDNIMPVTPGELRDWREGTSSFSAIGAARDGAFNLTGSGEPEMLLGYIVAPEILSILGVAPAIGRHFVESDGKNVVLLSHTLWSQRFGGDRGIVGRGIVLDGETYTVLGVMPEGFAYPRRVAIWTPLVIEPAIATSREHRFLRVLARLAPGVTLEAARADLAAASARGAAASPGSSPHIGSTVMSLRELDSGDIRTPLLVLSGAVGFLLLLACANVAALLLARAVSRRRELAIRVALGATRARLVRQLLGETLVVTLAGGVLAVLLASWSTDVLLTMFPKRMGNVNIPDVKDIPIDATVLLFSFLVSTVCAFLCGLPPALAATGGDVERTLRESTIGEAPRTARLRRWLVSGELALATVIAIGAALLLRTAIHVSNKSLGLEPSGVLTARLFISDKSYPEPAQQRQLVMDVLERLRAQPGVAEAGAVSTLPLSGWGGKVAFKLEGGTGEDLDAAFVVAEAGYFRALSIPLLRGRMFGPTDVDGAPGVVLIDDRLARRLVPGGDAIGKRLDLGSPGEPDWRTIVGVVGNVEDRGPTREGQPTVIVPFTQQAYTLVALVARAERGDAVALAGAVREATWKVDPDQPLSYIMTMDDLRADAMATTRVIAWMFGFFAIVALALGALGVYGVTANMVARRTREIGVRMALGARKIDVIRWVLRQAAPLVGAGLAVGLLVSLAVTRVLSSLLHGVTATDPLAVGTVCVVLALAALLACALPARRASRVDPVLALRAE